jgi:O-antigen/teichoic acid export membrane protein
MANLSIMIADFGFDILLASEVAQNENNALTISRKYFSIKVILALIAIIIMIAVPSFQTFSDESRMLIYVLSLYVIFTTFTNFFYAIFRGFEKFEYETRNSFLSNILLLIFLGILGVFKVPLIYLMLLFVIARLIGLLLGFKKVSLLLKGNILNLNYKGWKKIINQVLVFGLTFLFGNIFFQVDTLLIGIWKGDEAAGLYQSAFRIMILFLLLPDLLIGAFLPSMSRYFNENIDLWRRNSKLLYKILLLLSIPISILIYFNAGFAINLLYGANLYVQAIPVLQIFSLIIFVRFIAEPFGLMLTTSKRQVIRMILVILVSILSLIINYFVIPVYGLIGAAYVSLLLNIIVAVGYFLSNTSLFISWTLEKRNIALIFISTVFTFLFYYYGNNLIIFISFVTVYISAAYFIGFSEQERKVILSNMIFKRA